MKNALLLILLFLFSITEITAQVKVTLRKPTPTPKPATRTIVVTKQVPAAAPKSQGVVLIESNMDATVFVNGNNMGKVIANMPKTIGVAFGDNAISVVSLDGLYNEKQYHTCENSKQVILTFDLQSKKTAAEQAKRDEEAKLETERLAAKQVKWDIEQAKHIDWIEIPAGSFTMGSPESEADRDNDETQHQVSLSSFKMSKYEITFAQFDVFCEQTGRQKPSDDGWGRGNRPVINVSWDDANAFAQWMGCRLPTEVEWEYACRAGTTTPFNTGYSLSSANFNKINNKTMPVGSYPSNAWGLHDMHGNVWEWCSDFYGGTTEYASYRVNRGGSWNHNARYCRSAYRSNDEPSFRFSNLGFRVVAP